MRGGDAQRAAAVLQPGAADDDPFVVVVVDELRRRHRDALVAPRDDRRSGAIRQPPRRFPEIDRQLEDRRLALVGVDHHGAGKLAGARRRLTEANIEAESFRVVGDGAGCRLHRLARQRQELAASGQARGGANRIARRDRDVVLAGERERRDAESLQLVEGRVAGRAQRRVRAGDASFRRERAGELVAGERPELRQIAAHQLVLQIGGDAVAAEDEPPAPAPLERRPRHLKLRHRHDRIAERRDDPCGVELDVAKRRLPQRQRAADVVVGNRHRRRSRQQLAHRGFQLARAGERRRDSRLLERNRRIDAVEPSVVGGLERAVGDLDRHVGVGQHALEDLGAGQAPAASERQRRSARAGRLDVKVAREDAGVLRIAQPRDVESLAELPQLDARHVALAGVADRLRQRVDRADRAGADRRAEEFRLGERRAAGDERVAEAAVDVVVERQHALDARNRDRRRQPPQVDARGRALKMEGERRVDADRPVPRRHLCAVGGGISFRDEDRGRRDLAARPDAVRRVSHVHRVRPVEGVHAARKTASELEREVEGHVAGDVRRAFLPVQPSRQVEPLDVDGARAVPAGDRRVERQVPVHAAAGAGESQIGFERVHRSLERGVEVALDGDVRETAQHAGPLLKRELRRPHAQVEGRRPGRVVDDPVERERGPGGLHRQLLEEPAVRAAAERTAQRVDRQVRRVADPRDAIEPQRPAHRHVGEREGGVERLVVGRDVRGAEGQWVAERDMAVDDLDRLDPDRAPRPGPLLLARLALDQRADVPPPVSQFLRGDIRAGEPDAPDGHALRDQLADAVAERHLFDLDDRAAVAIERDVIELEAAEERPLQPADVQRRREVLVRLPDDQAANLVLRPARFRGRHRRDDEQKQEGDEPDQDSRDRGGKRSEPSKPRHLSSMLPTLGEVGPPDPSLRIRRSRCGRATAGGRSRAAS